MVLYIEGYIIDQKLSEISHIKEGLHHLQGEHVRHSHEVNFIAQKIKRSLTRTNDIRTWMTNNIQRFFIIYKTINHTINTASNIIILRAIIIYFVSIIYRISSNKTKYRANN